MCKCVNIDFQTYDRQTSMRMFGKWVCIDTCLVQEIAELWFDKIETIECCCGHNKNRGYIAVHKKHIKEMKDKGYKQLPRGKEFFYPLNKQ